MPRFQLNIEGCSMTTIIIRELKADDIDEFCRFLNANFYDHEPLLQTPGDHKFVSDTPEKRENRLGKIRQGLSIVAVDQSDGGRIVGCAYGEEMVPNDLENTLRKRLDKKPPDLLDHVLIFVNYAEIRSKYFEHFEVSKALHLNTLAVDARLRKQGLGRRLVAASIELGRSKGLPLIVAACTSFYSTRIMSALGMSCVRSEDYDDYKDQDGNVLFKPPEPHNNLNIMAMKL
ncbi:hypothetical protein KR044_007791 [Drosophila immigrans]|nr:hypothetical protein KR044_007791 [Drosophila immigrans]